MTVYVLLDSQGGFYLPGVFSSRERAKAAKERWEQYRLGFTSAHIAEVEIDKLASDP